MFVLLKKNCNKDTIILYLFTSDSSSFDTCGGPLKVRVGGLGQQSNIVSSESARGGADLARNLRLMEAHSVAADCAG